MSPAFFNNRTVVVSGVGMITALGGNREKTWARLLAGETGIVAGGDGLEAPVFDFVLNGARSRMGDFALIAAEEAVRHAGLNPFDIKGQPMGCAISQSKPVLSPVLHPFCHLEKNVQDELGVASQPSAVSTTSLDPSLLLASFTGWSAEAVVKNTYSLTGPSANVVAACATGIAAIDWGAYWIQSGQCSMALVGASESSLTPLYRAGFDQMGVLAKGNDPKAVRPFDKNRSGFAIGEGAAVLLLEDLESAKARKHTPLAVLQKTCLQHSAVDSIRFDPKGTAVARLVKSVLAGQKTPDYINAHGTATPFNDVVETRGLHAALGDESHAVPVSSTKAATGHLLGAAGAVEAAFSILAIRDNIVPPTINLTDPDPACDLNTVPNKAVERSVQSALSLSYGFGGQMGAVLFFSPSSVND